jgi:crotonobetainyl-CoA:carnitine CoA-transferase CaiB-like acyl-CoA transferase
VNLALVNGGPLPEVRQPKHGAPTNPLVGTYQTSDGKWIMLTMLQPGVYWPEFCDVVGRPELAGDDRFDSSQKIMANAAAAAELVAEILAERTFDEWVKAFDGMRGQWAAVQDPWTVGQDESLRANGLIAELTDADGRAQHLVSSPVQFDEQPFDLTRAPQFAEHTDEILSELGLDEEQMLQLKIAGAAT